MPSKDDKKVRLLTNRSYYGAEEMLNCIASFSHDTVLLEQGPAQHDLVLLDEGQVEQLIVAFINRRVKQQEQAVLSTCVGGSPHFHALLTKRRV